MARTSGSGPPKRERPALAGTGTLENNISSNTAAHKSKRTGAQAARLVADPRFRRRVQHLDRFGSRVVAELLAQLAIKHDCRADIEAFCDRIVENEQAIRTFNLDKWPPLPLRAVPR